MAIKFCLDFEKNNFVKVLRKYNYSFNIGDIFAGTIIGFEKSLCIVDIGSKIVAILPLTEISCFQSFFVDEIFKINDISEFLLLEYKIDRKIVIISLKKLKSIVIWQRLKTLIKENLIVCGQLEKSTRSGKIVRVEGLKAFIANSHLPKYYRRKKLRQLSLPLKFIELSERKNTIFLSCKLAHFKNQSKFLKIYQSVSGCITQIKPYGLFININGLKGLLHISEISSQRITDLTKMFRKGQLINVTILYINLERGRLSLSLKFFG
jgi:small subunit ribosomal protein S1